MLFLGFREAFCAGDIALYFRLDEDSASKAVHTSRNTPANTHRDTYKLFADEIFSEAPRERRPISLVWEFWNGTKWEELAVNDYTDSFHESGFVEFASPSVARKKEFNKNLFWLRLRFVSGSFEARPFVRAILLNAVYARNAVRYAGEIASSGTGGPNQKVKPAHGPLLPGIEIFINEGSIPPAKEIEAMRAGGIQEPYREEGEEVWVRYTEVPNLYSSGPQSRHFVVDYENGVIFFGDGLRGINPPRGKFNIKLASYAVGGGAAGNAAPAELRVLPQSIPFIAGCENPFAAEGGADRETLDSLKSRAAGILKSRGRAVTAEDFAALACEASASVGRAVCLQEKNRQGEIRVVIIPSPLGDDALDRKLTPSRELLRRVTLYLEARKLVGTRIRVQGPVYRGFRIMLTLTSSPGVLDWDRLRKSITVSLKKSFHALWGGGWEFGKAVSAGAVFKQLEKTEGILSVDEAILFDADAGVAVEKLVLKDDELPFLEEVMIAGRGE
jgi:hypothetical protein